ncbi:hypothetical protein [Nonomuraea sp. SYSU D8015]|uniref:hypothetical protein n=1 Tax=Nonomuraea sp. SYSU D8015 TaxID=2593644 RepID=UPI001660C0C1|nr:hypothetical protein [Nonomuraea sp. SYSU D8015]
MRADAVVDPAGAIQRQLVPGHGVRIVELSRMFMFGRWSSIKPVCGVVGFGKGRIVATDMKIPCRSWREPNDGPNRFAGDDRYYAFVDDLRLSDWGMKVDIKPPPADETVPSEELHD